MQYKNEDSNPKANLVSREIESRIDDHHDEYDSSESKEFLINFVKCYESKNFHALKYDYFNFINIHIPKVDLFFLFQYNIIHVLINLLNGPFEDAEDKNSEIVDISDFAIETLNFLIHQFDDSLEFFLSPPIEIQNYLYAVLEDSILKGTFSPRHILSCFDICSCFCQTKYIDLFIEMGFLKLFINYISLSFKETYITDDGSENIYINIEKSILETMNRFIITINKDDEVFKAAMDVYFAIFKEKKPKAYLFEIACDLFLDLISQTPTFITVLDKSKTFERFIYLIFESEIGEHCDEILTPIFELLAEVLYYKDDDYENEENQAIIRDIKIRNDILDELAKHIEASSLMGYLIEDIDDLKSEKYDKLYTNIFHLLSNLIKVLGVIPHDLVIEDISIVALEVLDNGRNELKIEMMYFLFKFCQFIDENCLTKLLNLLGSDFIDALILNLGSYDEDIFDCFLDLINLLFSKIGAFALTSDEISYFINKSIEGCIQASLDSGIKEEIALKASNILRDYSVVTKKITDERLITSDF